MRTEILRFLGRVCKTTTGSCAAVTFPWMAMCYEANGRLDSRSEQHRIFCQGAFCGPSRSLRAQFSLGSSLPIRRRSLQCDLYIFLRALVLAFSDKSLGLSDRRRVHDRSSCDFQFMFTLARGRRRFQSLGEKKWAKLLSISVEVVPSRGNFSPRPAFFSSCIVGQ